MVLIGGVARTFDLNMVSEAVNRKLEPMIVCGLKCFRSHQSLKVGVK